MIGSPENNFNTMQNQQPRNQMLGNALRNTSNYRQPNPAQPSMLPASQYGNPTPQMSNMQMPQSNASFNMQPPIPNMNQAPQAPQGPMGMGQSQGQNRFGVGLAKPMPQMTQVS
jgi:hypothetical protein